MIRLTKESDYAVVLLISLVEGGNGQANSASDLAAATQLPTPIVRKVLKALTRHGLLESVRGVHGGYRLARGPEAISVAEIIAAVEGPVAMTTCATGGAADCALHSTCSARQKWQRINLAIHQTLEGISLAEMASPLSDLDALVADATAAVTTS